MKRTYSRCALILLLIMSLSLTGCGIISFNHGTDENEETTSVDETTVPDEPEKYEGDYDGDVADFMKDLSGNTYGGGTVQIAVAGKNLITPDDNTPTVISQDMKERNEAVERELDISIISKVVDPDTMLDEIRAAVRSGSYYADAALLPQKYIGAYVAAGAIINLRSLPGFDTDPGYIYPTSVAAGTGGDAIYAVAGPASLDPECLSCIYFNKTLVEELGLESPYELVKRGEWTADKYAEYAASVSSLDGTYYSYGSQNASPYLSDLFFFAFGGKLTDSNVGYYPVLSLNGEGPGAIVAKVSSTVNMPGSYGSSLESINGFLSGKMLFLVDRLSAMKSICNSSFDWGILPLPKLNTEQKSYASLAYYGDAMFFTGISTAPDYGEVADVISALNIMAYGYSNDSYITNASYYYLRDNQSMNMLSYIVSCPVYDFAYSFGEVNSYVANGTFMAVRNTVAGISTLQ
ncbi:MAG: hypothetical protein PUC29_04820, partial [Clostridia bacterium]|nr:hypothetical protein [Clostridia bacterium]